MCGMKLIRREYDKSYSDNLLYREVPDSQRNKTRLAEIIKHRRGGRLLEIGGSKGGFLRLAVDHFDTEGIDVSEYAIDAIRTTFGRRVRVKNIETADLPLDHYDVIAAFNVLEHLHNPHSVIEKAHASLREDGILIGSVPNTFGLLGALVTKLGNLMDRTHVSTLPPARWRRLFEQARFEQISLFGEANFGKNVCFYVRNGLWKYLAPNLMFLCVK